MQKELEFLLHILFLVFFASFTIWGAVKKQFSVWCVSALTKWCKTSNKTRHTTIMAINDWDQFKWRVSWAYIKQTTHYRVISLAIDPSPPPFVNVVSFYSWWNMSQRIRRRIAIQFQHWEGRIGNRSIFLRAAPMYLAMIVRVCWNIFNRIKLRKWTCFTKNSKFEF